MQKDIKSNLQRVVLDQIIERLRLRIGILEHPEQVFEEHHLAADDGDGGVAIVAGPLHQFSEDRIVDDLGAEEVAAARLADVHGVKAGSGGDHLAAGIVVVGVGSGGGGEGGGGGVIVVRRGRVARGGDRTPGGGAA